MASKHGYEIWFLDSHEDINALDINTLIRQDVPSNDGLRVGEWVSSVQIDDSGVLS